MTDRELLIKIQTVLSGFVDDGTSSDGEIVDIREEVTLYLKNNKPEPPHHSGAVNQFDPH